MKHLMLVAVAVALAGSGAARAQEPQVDAGRKVRDRLASMRLNLDFNNAKFGEIVAYFQEYSGLNFHVDSETLARQDESRVTLRLKDVPLKTALRLVLRPRDLGCVLRNGVLVITPKSQLGAETVTRVYEARDLMLGIKDFAGPRMELRAPGEHALAGVLLIFDEEPVVVLASEILLDLVKANTGGASWDDSSASISEVNGLLIVSQSKPVHDEIRTLLDQLRQYK